MQRFLVVSALGHVLDLFAQTFGCVFTEIIFGVLRYDCYGSNGWVDGRKYEEMQIMSSTAI